MLCNRPQKQIKVITETPLSDPLTRRVSNKTGICNLISISVKMGVLTPMIITQLNEAVLHFCTEQVMTSLFIILERRHFFDI